MRILQKGFNPRTGKPNGTTQVKLENISDITMALLHLTDNPYWLNNPDKLLARIKNIAEGTCYYFPDKDLPDGLDDKVATNGYKTEFYKAFGLSSKTKHVCYACGEEEICKDMQIHHILPRLTFPDKAHDIENMVLVHQLCHEKIHTVSYYNEDYRK